MTLKVFACTTYDGERTSVEAIYISLEKAEAAAAEYARRHTDEDGHVNDMADIVEYTLNDHGDWLPEGAYEAQILADEPLDADRPLIWWRDGARPDKRTEGGGVITAYGRTAREALDRARRYQKRKRTAPTSESA